MSVDREKKEYEISFVVKNQGDEAVVSDFLSQFDAMVTYKSPVNEAYLSYPIKYHKHGYFGFFRFSVFPEAIEKITGVLNLDQSVLRFLIVTPPIGIATEKSFVLRRGVSRAKQESEVVPAIPPIAKSGMLSNEALEEKLEEILK